MVSRTPDKPGRCGSIMRRISIRIFAFAAMGTVVWIGTPGVSQAPNPPGQAQAPSTLGQTPAPPQAQTGQPPATGSSLIAIVPIDSSIPGSAASVDGPIQAVRGRAYISSSASITAGPATAQVTLPYRGTLRVCPSTKVRLSVDASVPASEVPPLMLAIDGGALETSFAIARNSDVVLTPNFRIMIGGPGASDVKIRLGPSGDTCVDNSGTNAPYVLVTSVFDSGLYRVQPGQRVMFEHGDLHTVVNDEKEPCGCPPPGQKENEFPLAQSEGLAPLLTLPPATSTNQPPGEGTASTTLVYNASGNQTPQPANIPQIAPPSQASATQAKQPAQAAAPQKKRGFFRKVGRFFKKVFGAE